MNDLLNYMKNNNQVEKVILIKSNQEEAIEIYAQIRKNNEIFIPDTSAQVVEGDVVYRNLPNGITEKYNIKEAIYNKGDGVAIPDTYLCRMIKI